MEIQSVVVGAPPPNAQIVEGTGDGTIKHTLSETAEGQPDNVTAWIPTGIALIARAGSVFTTTLVGQLGAGAGGLIPAQSWHDAAMISLSATAVALLISIGTLFGNLEKRFPIVSQLT